MAEPHRIQRRRTKGWRMPDGSVYVGRPTKWGNAFAYETGRGLARVPAIDGTPWEYEGRISAAGTRHSYQHPDGTWTHHAIRYMTRAECVQMYRQALTAPTPQIHVWLHDERRCMTVADVRAALAGRDLCCWCPLDQPCHADVLLEIANQPEDHRG
jgi:hypothetical protein